MTTTSLLWTISVYIVMFELGNGCGVAVAAATIDLATAVAWCKLVNLVFLLVSWYISLEIRWYWIPVMVFATLPIQNGWLAAVNLLSCCDAIFGVYLQSLDCARSKWSVPIPICTTTASLTIFFFLCWFTCFCQNLNQMNLEQVSKFKYGS